MSLSVIFGGERRIIVASDSRETFVDGRTNEDAVKLYPAGQRTALGIGGLYEVLDLGFNARELVAPVCSNPDLHDSPLRLLEAVRNTVFGPIFTLCRRCPEFMDWIHVNGSGDRIFGAFVVNVSVAGAIDLLELGIGVREVDGKVQLQGPEIITHAKQKPLWPFTYSTGMIAAAKVQEASCVDPDGFGDTITAQVQRTFNDARARFDERGLVGGEIDIAEIHPTYGLSWLQRKANR